MEGALENDEVLNVDDPTVLFDHYLNTVPNQGSRTVRTEEAVLISLSALRTKLNPKYKPLEFVEDRFKLQCNGAESVASDDVL